MRNPTSIFFSCEFAPQDHCTTFLWPLGRFLIALHRSGIQYTHLFSTVLSKLSVSKFWWNSQPSVFSVGGRRQIGMFKILFKVLSQISLALEIFGGSGTRPTSFPLLLMGLSSLQIWIVILLRVCQVYRLILCRGGGGIMRFAFPRIFPAFFAHNFRISFPSLLSKLTAYFFLSPGKYAVCIFFCIILHTSASLHFLAYHHPSPLPPPYLGLPTGHLTLQSPL